MKRARPCIRFSIHSRGIYLHEEQENGKTLPPTLRNIPLLQPDERTRGVVFNDSYAGANGTMTLPGRWHMAKDPLLCIERKPYKLDSR